MKLNTRKIKTIIVSTACTMPPQSPIFTIGRTVLKESDDLDIFGMTCYSKMTVKNHQQSVSRSASPRHGTLRKSLRVFHDTLVGDTFQVLSCQFLEYCSALWCSAPDTHLKLLDRVISFDVSF